MTRMISFLIFFSIVLLVYGAVNYYLFVRGYQALGILTGLRPGYVAAFLILSSSYILGRLLERAWLSTLSDVLTWVGSFWLAAMLYFLLAVILADLLRLLLLIPSLRSLVGGSLYVQVRTAYAGFTLLTVIVLLGIGYYNASRPVVRTLDLELDGRDAAVAGLSLVMVSDIHLGTIIGNGRLERLTRTVNGLNPDLILLAGDIVDEDLAPVIRQNLGEGLRKLRAPLGVWAITGNHEYIGGAEKAVTYLREHGIRLLRDSAVKIEGRCWLVGREDRDKPRFSGKARKPLKDVLSATDPTLPVILMDHQPFSLQETAAHPVGLQLSGHTHHGQIWPLSRLTGAIYEVSRGYRKIGNTHFFVSSGFGTWGPPVRIGSRSEIVFIRLNFK